MTHSRPQPMFVEADLARALEHAEAHACRAFGDAAANLYPTGGIRSVASAGGFAIFYGPADPLNAVKGPGLAGPVDPTDWDAAEALYSPSKSPVVVDLCPLADDAFVSMLTSRGYVIGSFETVTARALGPDESLPDPPATPGLTIDEIGPEDARAWSRVLDLGFANGGEPARFAVDIGAVRAAMPDARMLLATIEGIPAGGAGMSICGKVALMSGAAVLPGFRGRGIQQALTAARLRIAQQHDCRWAKLDVRAGSPSYRNAVRAGFQVAYTRPQLIRTWHAV